MDKYVAFLDILGFKDVLNRKNQIEAQQFIREFSKTIYDVYERKMNSSINGYVVSDSLIIYTNDASKRSLNSIIEIIIEICQEEFKLNSILIRGAIAKGDFEMMDAKELSNLQKGLIVGNAYVEAYKLESIEKNIGIILSEKVYDDFISLNGETENIITANGINVLRYLSIDYLLETINLTKFVELAINSEWLPHYYNTIYYAMLNVKNNKKVTQLFDNIFEIIENNNLSENWSKIDLFIKNAFNNDVKSDFYKRFLRYIRNRMF